MAIEVASMQTMSIGSGTSMPQPLVVGGTHAREGSAALCVVRRIAAGVDHRGSDVRIGLGEGLKLSAWPWREVPSRAWSWKTIPSVPWKTNLNEHINALEMRSTLLALRWRARNSRCHYKRAVHLNDSGVATSVLTKRPSASFRLMPIVRKVNALELAASISLLHSFNRSIHNPAGRPSRTFTSRRGVPIRTGQYSVGWARRAPITKTWGR